MRVALFSHRRRQRISPLSYILPEDNQSSSTAWNNLNSSSQQSNKRPCRICLQAEATNSIPDPRLNHLPLSLSPFLSLLYSLLVLLFHITLLSSELISNNQQSSETNLVNKLLVAPSTTKEARIYVLFTYQLARAVIEQKRALV